jgi:hypothetical protein
MLLQTPESRNNAQSSKKVRPKLRPSGVRKRFPKVFMGRGAGSGVFSNRIVILNLSGAQGKNPSGVAKPF